MTGRRKWLFPEDAIELVRVAEEAKLPLLGFDAAYVSAAQTQPSLEDSWDYESAAYPPVPNPYVHACQFIQERAGKGLHFEIVLGIG